MKKFLILSLILTLSCATGKKEDPAVKPDNTTTQNTNLESKNDLEEFIHPKEGFVTGSIFQVVVFSLKPSGSEAKSDALDVAKKKSVNLLTAAAKQPLSSPGRTELKSLAEESGKIVKESGLIDGKYYYIYQIQKPGLQIYIKEKLN